MSKRPPRSRKSGPSSKDWIDKISKKQPDTGPDFSKPQITHCECRDSGEWEEAGTEVIDAETVETAESPAAEAASQTLPAPAEELFQGRPIGKWLSVVAGELDRTSDDSLMALFRHCLKWQLADIRAEYWNTEVFTQVGKAAIRILRSDTAGVRAITRFALSTGQFWSDQSLTKNVCWRAFESSLVTYIHTLVVVEE